MGGRGAGRGGGGGGGGGAGSRSPVRYHAGFTLPALSSSRHGIRFAPDRQGQNPYPTNPSIPSKPLRTVCRRPSADPVPLPTAPSPSPVPSSPGPLPAVDCAVSEWADPGPCSKKCGGGQQTQRREAITAATDGGRACPSLVRTAPCNTHACGMGCGVQGGHAPVGRERAVMITPSQYPPVKNPFQAQGKVPKTQGQVQDNRSA